MATEPTGERIETEVYTKKRHNQNWRTKTPPIRKALPLSGLLFDLFLDGIPHPEAEAQIRAAAANQAEATNAVARFRAMAGKAVVL